MPKHVAFLRAINVGGHVVKMDQLRTLFEGLGLSGVETFINSGNVIFDLKSKASRAFEKKVETHLQQALGYPVETFVRSTAELATIADYRPFDDAAAKANGGAVYIGFLESAPSEDSTRNLLLLANRVDDFHVWERQVYWLCRGRFSDSGVSGALIEKKLSMRTTFRNSNTVHRIVSKYA